MHLEKKASGCQLHSFLTAGLMEKSCPLQPTPPAPLYLVHGALHYSICTGGMRRCWLYDTSIMIYDATVQLAEHTRKKKNTNGFRVNKHI